VRRDGVLLDAGALLVVDLTLEVAGVQDQVTIEAHAGGVDVRSPAAPFRIDQTLLFNLPTTRDASRLINLVPGVAADVAYGGSQRSNALTVDGTTMTEPSFQDPQVRVNQNWVEQVHVTGRGFPQCRLICTGEIKRLSVLRDIIARCDRRCSRFVRIGPFDCAADNPCASSIRAAIHADAPVLALSRVAREQRDR
jgi:hypothetical protein